jgi:hypothetical protein
MLPVGMVLTFTGYGIASWGWILIKGYNIPLRSWFSPLHPYQWPASGQPPTVPQGRLFPGPPPGASGTASNQPPPPNSIYNVPGVGPLLHFARNLFG